MKRPPANQKGLERKHALSAHEPQKKKKTRGAPSSARLRAWSLGLFAPPIPGFVA